MLISEGGNLKYKYEESEVLSFFKTLPFLSHCEDSALLSIIKDDGNAKRRIYYADGDKKFNYGEVTEYFKKLQSQGRIDSGFDIGLFYEENFAFRSLNKFKCMVCHQVHEFDEDYLYVRPFHSVYNSSPMLFHANTFSVTCKTCSEEILSITEKTGLKVEQILLLPALLKLKEEIKNLEGNK